MEMSHPYTPYAFAKHVCECACVRICVHVCVFVCVCAFVRVCVNKSYHVSPSSHLYMCTHMGYRGDKRAKKVGVFGEDMHGCTLSTGNQ